MPAVPELTAAAAIDTTTEQVDPVDSIDTTAYDVSSPYDDGSSYESSSYRPASDARGRLTDERDER